MPVALDVAALAADDEDHRFLVEGIRDLARRRRLGVEEPARAEVAGLALDLDAHRAAVDEVELVLRVVVMGEPFVARRVDERVDAERGDAERLADLAEAGPVAELVEGGERVAHSGSFVHSRPSSSGSRRRPNNDASVSRSSSVKREPKTVSMSAMWLFLASRYFWRPASVRTA